LRPPPRPTLFPYTTLFRSDGRPARLAGAGPGHRRHLRPEPTRPAAHNAGGLPIAMSTPSPLREEVGQERSDETTRAIRLTQPARDRKSTRLNSSHLVISYA